MTVSEIERRLEEIKEELQRLQLEARGKDGTLERMANAAWRELNIGKAAFL
jgi:hypothetical protein